MTGNRRSAGRSLYRTTVVGVIIEQVASGLTVRQIVQNPEMPCEKTLYNWLKADASLRARFDAARGRTRRDTSTGV